MRSRTTRQFRDRFRQLAAVVQRQARNAYRLFENNPAHPGLHFKKVSQTRPIYSARVSDDCRVLGVVEEGSAIWFWIGFHAEYDRILRTL